MITVKTRTRTIRLSWTDETSFGATVTLTEGEEGVEFIHLIFRSPEMASLPPCTLSWEHPLVDIHVFWRTSGDQSKGLLPDFAGKLHTTAISQAPVCCLHSFSGQNRLTFAFSDALHTVKMSAGVHEETAMLNCTIDLFDEPIPPTQHYEATLRIDTRDMPYSEALAATQKWWAAQSAYQPALVPELTRLPVYSTWYSFHQQFNAAQVEEQCRLAKELGCEAVIVDDGWQTTNTARGYAYTGDWEVAQEKIPDMRAHVTRVHALGMKYVLWYAVPFVGVSSKAYRRFAGKLLYTMGDGMGSAVLDPRFPEVREFLISTYEQAMRNWNLDGFKLDFVDCFNPPEHTLLQSVAGNDCQSVPEAVDRLLKELLARLRAARPGVMIEFRQPSIGPLMRTYGNMFRAADCPNDALTNRIRTLDLRLLSGNTAVHSDMLMWHPDEPVESAALQLINILFAVPQISVLLNTLPASHLVMLRYWLAFWREHRDVLLDGGLAVLHPETHYPLVRATNAQKRVVVAYQEAIIDPGLELPDTLIVVNGTREKRVVLDIAENLGKRQATIRNCQGEIISEKQLVVPKGFLSLDVPAAGVCILSSEEK